MQPRDWQRKQAGQGMVEYALIIGLISIVVLVLFLNQFPAFKNLVMEGTDSQSVDDSRAATSQMVYQ